MTGNRRADVLDDEEGWRYGSCKSEVEKQNKKMIIDAGVQDLTVIEKQVVAVNSLPLYEQA